MANGKIITIHSYKGGTGKTLISTNLATMLAMKGNKVSLLDMDFRAPSLHSLFNVTNANYWLNDYLNGACNMDKVLVNYSDEVHAPLYVGFADPTTEAIREMASKDRKWEMRALGRLFSLKNILDDMGFNYLVMDTSPGLIYSSINAVVSSDIVIVVTTTDSSDVKGTRQMVSELYDLFEKKTGILINKVLMETISSDEDREKLSRKYSEEIKLPVIDVIPCFCDILKMRGKSIFVKEKPEHYFTKILDEIATKIQKL